VTRFLGVAALVLTIAAAAPAAAAPAEERQAASVRVYFLQGEQLVAVTRPGSTVKAAVTSRNGSGSHATASPGFRRELRTPARAARARSRAEEAAAVSRCSSTGSWRLPSRTTRSFARFTSRLLRLAAHHDARFAEHKHG
jgi:hypothetical protein